MRANFILRGHREGEYEDESIAGSCNTERRRVIDGGRVWENKFTCIPVRATAREWESPAARTVHSGAALLHLKTGCFSRHLWQQCTRPHLSWHCRFVELYLKQIGFHSSPIFTVV